MGPSFTSGHDTYVQEIFYCDAERKGAQKHDTITTLLYDLELCLV